MKIDSIDIRSFDAKQLTVDFEPPQTGVTVEMFDGALIPSESETYTPLSGLTVTVLFRGKDRDEVQKHVSDFNAELQKGVVLTLDGYSRHFKAYMTGNSLSKTITKTRYTAELQMKGNWQVFRFDYTEKKTGKRKGRPLDFMGFQFYHDKTILRESIMLSCTRKVNRVAKKEKITWYDATAILSYMGYLSNTDTYDMYLQRVKPYVNVKKLKKIVSKHSKRKEREKHERMERSVRNGGRTAGGVRHNSVTDNGISETQYQESNERGCRRKENHRMAARGA